VTVYCYDTEFLEDGKTIDLISIGIMCEDGREYYAVNSDMDVDRIRKDDWLMDNVVRSLPTHSTGQVEKRKGFTATGWSWGGLDMRNSHVKPKRVIANEVRDFLLAKVDFVETEVRNEPELWAHYGAYDHVALAQLWGKMIHKPRGIPMWTHDLMQLIEQLEDFQMPAQDGTAHNALDDARWNMAVLRSAGRAGT
jgi:hypothetical protein